MRCRSRCTAQHRRPLRRRFRSPVQTRGAPAARGPANAVTRWTDIRHWAAPYGRATPDNTWAVQQKSHNPRSSGSRMFEIPTSRSRSTLLAGESSARQQAGFRITPAFATLLLPGPALHFASLPQRSALKHNNLLPLPALQVPRSDLQPQAAPQVAWMNQTLPECRSRRRPARSSSASGGGRRRRHPRTRPGAEHPDILTTRRNLAWWTREAGEAEGT